MQNPSRQPEVYNAKVSHHTGRTLLTEPGGCYWEAVAGLPPITPATTSAMRIQRSKPRSANPIPRCPGSPNSRATPPEENDENGESARQFCRPSVDDPGQEAGLEDPYASARS